MEDAGGEALRRWGDQEGAGPIRLGPPVISRDETGVNTGCVEVMTC